MLYWLFHDYARIAWIPATIFTVLGLLVLFLFLFFAPAIRTSATRLASTRSLILRFIFTSLLTLAVASWFVFATQTLAITRALSPQSNFFLLTAVVGPTSIFQIRLLIFGVFLILIMSASNAFLYLQTRPGALLRDWLQSLRTIRREQEAEGSSHFASPREYKPFVREQAAGVNLFGEFRGEKRGRRYTSLGGLFCLSPEDAARGILTVGNPGSGKSSSVILPILYDSMRYGQNLVVADPQLELTKHIIRYAAIFGHRVIVHDPTNPERPRFNLAAGVDNVTAARSVGGVLVPKSGGGGDDFWSKSAEGLLAACLIRYDTIGAIFTAFGNIEALGTKLAEKDDDARRLAASFIDSATGDAKLAGNIVATLQTSLTAWADQTIRQTTGASDFDALLLTEKQRPTVLILACPGKYRDAVAPYLGAVLTRILLDLDAIGEKTESGALPIPVKFIIDEFPTLGDLSVIVAQANLVRKRRISFMLAFQTLGQIENIYGKNGMDTLLAGMAFQIVFGGTDKMTAEHYSSVAGDMTVTETREDGTKSHRRRRLLTPDEIVRPPFGNALIFGRYVTADFATYILVLARLTRIYEREDVKEQVHLVDRKKAKIMPLGGFSKRKRKAKSTISSAQAVTAGTSPAPALVDAHHLVPKQDRQVVKPLCEPEEWKVVS